MRRLVDLILALQNGLGVLLFAALTVVVTLQVVSRFVFHAPFLWSEEVARFLFFWVALTGAGISVRYRRHFVIDVLPAVDGDPRGLRSLRRRFMAAVADCVILGFAVFLLIVGLQYTEVGLFRIGTNSRINMVIVYAAIPFAGATMILFGLANLVETLTGREGDERSLPAAGED